MNNLPVRFAYIYVLLDPDSQNVRYVGWTTDPEKRLKSHLLSAQKERNHRANWIRSLKVRGQRPILRVIESGLLDWSERERFWIKQFRQAGANLTNSTDGGEGMLGFKPTEEQRRRLSERLKGKPGNRNFRPTQAMRDAVAQSNRQRVWTDKSRQAVSQAARGRPMPEHVREMLKRQFRNAREAAKQGLRQWRTTAGMPISAAAREKMSLAKKGKRPSDRAMDEHYQRSIKIEAYGRRLSIREWAAILHIDRTTIWLRFRKGRSPEDCVAPHRKFTPRAADLDPKIKVKRSVPVLTCKGRALDAMRVLSLNGNGCVKAAAVASFIWPDAPFTRQGAGASASRILKLLAKEGHVSPPKNRKVDGWKLVYGPPPDVSKQMEMEVI